MAPRGFASGWFGVRCLFQWPQQGCYEERITIWQASSFEDAIRKAEFEATEYADTHALLYLGLAQGFWMVGEDVTEGSEVFSLLRQSDLGVDAYLEEYFDTGTERQQHWQADPDVPRETSPG